MGADVKVRRVQGPAAVSLLEDVHSKRYVAETIAGYNSEWGSACRPDLGEVARIMFQGTVDMVWKMEAARKPGVYFSPQGAKHHAMYGQGSGFCVFADFAWAANYLSHRGHRVLVIDTDAHHGDGTEALTYGNQDVMTASIHDSTIFPGTGHYDAPTQHVYNFPLEGGAGDEELLDSVEWALEIASKFDPTVVLVAVGGDGYVDDPLSSLQYTYTGYARAAQMIGEFAQARGISTLVGGAGGYLPHTHTPAVWATFVGQLASMYNLASV